MINIGIVGTGKIATEMLPVLKEMEQINVYALCGTKRSEEKVKTLARDFMIPNWFTDLDELCELKELDAIYIAVPNNLHFELAKRALQNSKNVFLEKPFTLTFQEAKELIEIAKDNHCVILEAISNQYLPMFEELQKALPLVGDIKYVEMNFSQYSSRFDQFMAGEYFPVFDRKAGGGALYDINIYNLHMAVGLFGMPKDFSYVKNEIRDVDTSGVATLVYDNFVCSCVGAKDSQGPNHLLIQGTKGYLLVEAPTNTLQAPLKFYDVSSKETQILFEPDSSVHRMTYEFAAVDRLFMERDLKECERRQEETLFVCDLVERIYESTGI